MDYKAGLETKANIIQTARVLFYQKGFNHTTYQDIATNANVKLGTITYHFKTLDKIASIIFDEILEQRDIAFEKKFSDFFSEQDIPAKVFLKHFSNLDCYIRYPGYARFIEDVSLREQVSIENPLMSEINALCTYFNQPWTNDKRLLSRCLIIPYDIFYIVNMYYTTNVSIDEAWEFFVESVLKLFDQTNEEIEQLLKKLRSNKDKIRLEIDSMFEFY